MSHLYRPWQWLAFVAFGWIFPSIAFLPPASRQISSPTIITSLCYKSTDDDTKTEPKRRRRRGWNLMYPRLYSFYQEHGHSVVTSAIDPELYEWVRTLRYQYLYQIRNQTTTYTRSRLSDEKLKALRDVNFVWETKQNQFDSMMKRLKAYRKEHGNVQIEASDATNADLYQWSKYIRYNYRYQALNQTVPNTDRRPKLSQENLMALKRVGFRWDTKRKQNRWRDMYPRLVEFKEKHGHTFVTMDDDLALYQWTKSLILNYGHQLQPNLTKFTNSSRAQLSREKVDLLQKIEFQWGSHSNYWDRRFKELRDFHDKHGHCRVLKREHPQLGVFVQNLRKEYKRSVMGKESSLTDDRVEALRAIDFDFGTNRESTWAKRRADLDDFWETEGHSNVPQDYSEDSSLGKWCMNQRSHYRNRKNGQEGSMTQERIDSLEDVDFEWNIREVRWRRMWQRLKEYQEEHGDFDISTSDSDNQDLRQWLNEQRYFFRKNDSRRMTPERIEALESLPQFSWRRQRGLGPSKSDWSDLFVAMREKGIVPGAKAKTHIFDGMNRFDEDIKTEWTEQELLALWNEENEDDEEDDGKYEDEILFLRA